MLRNGCKVELLARYPNLRRMIGLGVSFVAVGSVAGLSALALLASEDDRAVALAVAPQATASRTAEMSFTDRERRQLEAVAGEKIPSTDLKAKCGRACDGMAARAPVEGEAGAAPLPLQPVAATEPAAMPASAPAENESAPESMDTPAPLTVIAPVMAESAAPKPPKAQRRQSRSHNAYEGFPLIAFDHRGRPRLRSLFW
jgi:hypothetical protein